MTQTSDLTTPSAARQHARAQAGTRVTSMPTIPASSAEHLPAGIAARDVVWDETLAAGAYCARILKRGTRLRLINAEGDACANFLVYNADRPIERLNVADTVKVQWNAYLGAGKLLLSDMGRVLMSITQDTSGRHDTFCGASTVKSVTRRYGTGTNFSDHPNARDRFALALAKYGLARKDIAPNVNFFKRVTVLENGSFSFDGAAGMPGEFMELRAEMNVLVVIVNAPHVIDPRPLYSATPLRVLASRGVVAPAHDPIRNSTPEALRAFQNSEDLYLE